MDKIILFTFLALFPFGQIIRIGNVHPIDLVVGLAAIYSLIKVKKFRENPIGKYSFPFALVAAFSFIISLFVFSQKEILYGLLYLVRLLAYFQFFRFLFIFKDKKFLLKSLLTLSIVTAIFGWIQYFWFPDIRAFAFYGWDDHLYRIVGTFLDPAFLALILILGIIISPNLLISLFLTLTLAFTYSRAGYLAFFAAIIAKGVFEKKFKKMALLVVSLFALILFLPRPGGEGIKLERTSTVFARLENYEETIRIFKESPLFGIGFNNICLARQKYIEIDSFTSHSCSGADSSLLFILATTGVLGIITFIYLLINLWHLSGFKFRIGMLAIFVHSIFTNSLFYPWIMGYLAILFATSVKKIKKKN